MSSVRQLEPDFCKEVYKELGTTSQVGALKRRRKHTVGRGGGVASGKRANTSHSSSPPLPEHTCQACELAGTWAGRQAHRRARHLASCEILSGPTSPAREYQPWATSSQEAAATAAGSPGGCQPPRPLGRKREEDLAAGAWLDERPAFGGAPVVSSPSPAAAGPGSASNTNDAAGFKTPTSWWGDVTAPAQRRAGQHGGEGKLEGGGKGGRPQGVKISLGTVQGQPLEAWHRREDLSLMQRSAREGEMPSGPFSLPVPHRGRNHIYGERMPSSGKCHLENITGVPGQTSQDSAKPGAKQHLKLMSNGSLRGNSLQGKPRSRVFFFLIKIRRKLYC